MSQHLPTGGFKWTDVNPNKISELATRTDKFYVLEVDVSYPKDLHSSHNDLPFMCERMEINGVEKLVPNHRDKKNYVILIQLECYMDWFPSLICKNYIFKLFVKTVEPTSMKFCTIIELITLHLEYTIAQVKYANFSYAHAQTFVLLNGEMATVSTGFRKLKFWLWLLRTVFYLNQTFF